VNFSPYLHHTLICNHLILFLISFVFKSSKMIFNLSKKRHSSIPSDIGEQVSGEQASLESKCPGSNCRRGASVIGEQVSGEQLSLGSKCRESKCPGSKCRGSNCLGSTSHGFETPAPQHVIGWILISKHLIRWPLHPEIISLDELTARK